MGRRMDHRRLPLLGTLGVAIVALAGCAPVFAGPSHGVATPAPAGSPGLTRATPALPTASGSSSKPSAQPSPSEDPASSPAASVEPSPSPSERPALVPPPTTGPFEMDLYRRGDFTTEMRPIWCAPAALQTMINIMSPGADGTRATQKLLHTISRRLGPAPDKGSEPEGMARTLESLGYGRYRVVVAASRTAAFRAAATAIRMTGRPVALLVWRGAHNWVMSGFRSTADPAIGPDFKVTHLWIEDVWYPRISNIWGESRPPDSLVPAGLMPQDYLPWRRPTGRYPGKDGKFVLIVPVAAS
jgi:hypothetical protein